MLKTIKREVICPNCKNTFEIKERVAINVTLDPGLKEKTLKGKIFQHTCPNCQKEVLLVNDCMYHDLEKQFMVYLMLEESKQRQYTIPIGANGLGDFGENYKLRLEKEYNGFRERIHLLDLGFNDMVFEIMRALLLTGLQEKIPEATRLFFLGVSKGEICFQVITGTQATRLVNVSFDLYERVDKIFAKFPEATEKVNALRQIDAEWLEERE